MSSFATAMLPSAKNVVVWFFSATIAHRLCVPVKRFVMRGFVVDVWYALIAEAMIAPNAGKHIAIFMEDCAEIVIHACARIAHRFAPSATSISVTSASNGVTEVQKPAPVSGARVAPGMNMQRAGY